MFVPVFSLLVSAPAAAQSEGLPAATAVGLAQTWVTLFDQDEDDVADAGGYGDPEDDSGFKLRRVRVGIEGRSDNVKYGITVGGGAPYDGVAAAQGSEFNIGLVDTYGGYSPTDGLWLTAGLQKVPVSREALMASSQLVLTDRSPSTHWLTPGRDVGAVVDHRWKNVRTRIGAFNGGGDLTGDADEGKLVAGRVEWKTGEGAVYRTHGSVEGLTIGVAADASINTEAALTTQAVGADFIVRTGGLAMLAEARMVTASPNDELDLVPGVFADTTRQGFMAQVGYTVAQLEPVVRYSFLDDNTDLENAGDVAELMSGVTWHGARDAIRAGLGYALRVERGPNTRSNDTVRAWLQLKI